MLCARARRTGFKIRTKVVDTCSTVRPGVHATDINIHNPNTKKRASIDKNFQVLVLNGVPLGREPKNVKGKVLDKIVLQRRDHHRIPGADQRSRTECDRRVYHDGSADEVRQHGVQTTGKTKE